MKRCVICDDEARTNYQFPLVVFPEHWPRGRRVHVCTRCATILEAVVMLERGHGFFNCADDPHVEPARMLERVGFFEREEREECSAG